MQIVLTSLAKTDIDRGFDFYMSDGEDIAIRFVETVLSKLSELESKAGIHAKVFRHYRMLIKPFPYAVYYDIVNGTVLVRAVLDCRRSPRMHRDRAKNRF